jgi:protein-L-isoaspartate(D-aspartate) O-methyltransferase
MVQSQIVARGISDSRIILAMEKVPRHLFVPAGNRYNAYQDCALPIGHRQTISQPYVVALMLELAGLSGTERVLEIGTGSGYSTALLSRLCREVVSVERIAALARRANMLIDGLGCKNVRFFTRDGSTGCCEYAPYDVIVLWAAAAAATPPELFNQLVPGGTLVAPEGVNEGPEESIEGRPIQMLVRYKKAAKGLSRTEICAVSFVPLITE